ncbi:putative F-box protein PP2-B12 isoform X2 [Beta vulgaris subsp. vulgaris]|uniref:putative F-box protein PP2-B12 isoform X2 n=1 Tax=Beta vulgaris subsp. vulgaris TaxID=3555 RepID=UPI0020374E8D|nr:putative F-box protein PP2-B12 isoform X2 [Beta vulgaris subsp. vulgaris]
MAVERQKEEEREGVEIFCGADFNVLPEECIAAIFTFTNPRDACRFDSVSTTFKSAADSDLVWEHFLPSDYRQILARSNDGQALLDSLSKKQLFLHLAHTPLLIDGGILSFSLEKSTGKKCYTIGARNLSISWGDTPTYWQWNSMPKSRFSEVAKLIYVWWLEIRGKIKTSMLSPNTHYGVYLVFNVSEDLFGLYDLPVKVGIKTGGGELVTGNVYLDPRRAGIIDETLIMYAEVFTEKEDDVKLPKKRGNDWLEVEIGELLTTGEDEDVEMSILEVEAGKPKGGFYVDGIEIRPKII